MSTFLIPMAGGFMGALIGVILCLLVPYMYALRERNRREREFIQWQNKLVKDYQEGLNNEREHLKMES